MEGTDKKLCDEASYSAMKEDPKYSAMKEDPEYLHSFVDKYVTVKVIQGKPLLGFVHTIDPVTFSVILRTPEGGSFKSVIIAGHAVLDVIVTPIPEGITPPSQNEEKLTHKEDAAETIKEK